MKLFNILFKDTEDDKIFRATKKRVKGIKHQLQFKLETSPSTNTHTEIEFIKNRWLKLPEAFGSGVITMGMEESEKRKCFLVHYESNSELFNHSHPKNLERIQILTGCIKDMITDIVYQEGETFVIDKNESHHIITTTEEAYLFIVFSEELATLEVNYLIK